MVMCRDDNLGAGTQGWFQIVSQFFRVHLEWLLKIVPWTSEPKIVFGFWRNFSQVFSDLLRCSTFFLVLLLCSSISCKGKKQYFMFDGTFLTPVLKTIFDSSRKGDVITVSLLMRATYKDVLRSFYRSN